MVHSFFQAGLTPVEVKLEGKTLQITASETMKTVSKSNG